MKRTKSMAKLACAYSGVVWGLFWIPLRAMDEAGISGAWSTLVFYLVPLVMMLPLLVIPSGLAVFWGTPLLSPGIVGLLFMTEISVGAVTAALWAGEPFGVREIIGVVLITAAGLAESVPLPLLTERTGA